MDVLELAVLQGILCPLCSQRRANLPSRGFLTQTAKLLFSLPERSR